MKESSIIPLLQLLNKGLPFKIQTFQKLYEQGDDARDAVHVHNYYEMIWLTRGGGTLYADMQEYSIESNTIFCLRPDQAHQFQITEGMDGFIFSFKDSFFSINEHDFNLTYQASLCQLFTERLMIGITQEMEEDMREIVLKLIKEFENQNPYRLELLKRYFKIFLIYLLRTLDENVQSAEQSRETKLVQLFWVLLDKNFKEKKMVAEYASELSVTPNYLNRIVKKITGFSAGHHIRQRVVLEAKRMGRFSDAGMKEIAYDLGFLDSAHFSKFFKSFAGVNFSAFKKGAFILPLNMAANRA